MLESGDVIVLTGASRGLGARMARDLARSGAHLVLAARSREELEALAAELRQEGAEATAVPTDVTAAEDRRRLLQTAEALGPVTLLVNNAGAIEEVVEAELGIEGVRAAIWLRRGFDQVTDSTRYLALDAARAALALTSVLTGSGRGSDAARVRRLLEVVVWRSRRAEDVIEPRRARARRPLVEWGPAERGAGPRRPGRLSPYMTTPQRRTSAACRFAQPRRPSAIPPRLPAIATAATATAAAAAAARSARTRLVDGERTPAQLSPVEGLDGVVALAVVGHLDEREAAGAARVPIHDHVDPRHRTVVLEELLELGLAGGEGKIADVDVLQVKSPARAEEIAICRESTPRAALLSARRPKKDPQRTFTAWGANETPSYSGPAPFPPGKIRKKPVRRPTVTRP